LRRALRDRVDDFRNIEAGALRKIERLGERLDETADADLVDHLGQLSAAGAADESNGLGVRADDGLGFAIVGLFAADHHGEGAGFGSGLSAGNWRVQKAGVSVARCCVQFAGDCRGRRGVIDRDGAWLEAGERAVWAERHGAEMIVIADAEKDEIRIFRRVGRTCCDAAAELLRPTLSSVPRAVEDGDLVAAALS
jgi:hypothetical protein